MGGFLSGQNFTNATFSGTFTGQETVGQIYPQFCQFAACPNYTSTPSPSSSSSTLNNTAIILIAVFGSFLVLVICCICLFFLVLLFGMAKWKGKRSKRYFFPRRVFKYFNNNQGGEESTRIRGRRNAWLSPKMRKGGRLERSIPRTSNSMLYWVPERLGKCIKDGGGELKWYVQLPLFSKTHYLIYHSFIHLPGDQNAWGGFLSSGRWRTVEWNPCWGSGNGQARYRKIGSHWWWLNDIPYTN